MPVSISSPPNPLSEIKVISTEILTGAAANFTAVTIPTGYTAFYILINCEMSGNAGINMQLNDDAAANYSDQYLSVAGAGVSGSYTAAQSRAALGSALANLTTSIYAFCPQSSVLNKSILSYEGQQNSIYLSQSCWNSTAAIVKIYVFASANNFKIGSRLTILGVV
jgi:hypothetical protein